VNDPRLRFASETGSVGPVMTFCSVVVVAVAWTPMADVEVDVVVVVVVAVVVVVVVVGVVAVELASVRDLSAAGAVGAASFASGARSVASWVATAC